MAQTQHRVACGRDLVAVAGVLLGVVLGAAAQALAVDWVEVDDPGNSCDAQAQGCFGAVSIPDGHRIGLFEVTNSQYVEFLNAIAASDPNGVYDLAMSGGLGGIDRFGASPNFVYQIKAGGGPRPVNFVTYASAQRFANWLHNGQPSGAQSASTTEDGAYTFSGPGAGGPRNPGAVSYLPNEDEWYKAAYYDRATSRYFDHPAAADAQTSCVPNFSSPNSANCNNAVGALTPVGSYTMSDSPYGTRDQGGNVAEWTETSPSAGQRVVAGASSTPAELAAATRTTLAEGTSSAQVGFRVAAPGLPEGLDLFYDFEGDAGEWAADKLPADGHKTGGCATGCRSTP